LVVSTMARYVLPYKTIILTILFVNTSIGDAGDVADVGVFTVSEDLEPKVIRSGVADGELPGPRKLKTEI